MITQQCERCLSLAVMPVGVCLNCGFHNDPLPEYQRKTDESDHRHTGEKIKKEAEEESSN